jgi:hypothetical protein
MYLLTSDNAHFGHTTVAAAYFHESSLEDQAIGIAWHHLFFRSLPLIIPKNRVCKTSAIQFSTMKYMMIHLTI